jgi:hypothetical protein
LARKRQHQHLFERNSNEQRLSNRQQKGQQKSTRFPSKEKQSVLPVLEHLKQVGAAADKAFGTTK